MKTSSIASAAGALCIAACAAFPTASTFPSPGSLTPTANVASHGSVYFVSTTDAWVVTQPPDQLRTVVLRTVDGGEHWKLWGIAPEPGAPVAFSANEVLLSFATDLLRSSDGVHWAAKPMPTFGQPTFLPDMQHGWLGGFANFIPAAPSPTTIPGKGGGGGGTTGKGGTTSSAPAPCQDKGCQPTALWSTSDGGTSWRLLLKTTLSGISGPMYFMSPSIGLVGQGLTLLLTRDGGASWHPLALAIPNVTPDQSVTELQPTMYDATHGVLPIQAPTGVYLSRTADGGLTWSAPERVNDCAQCAGQLMVLDDRHWLDFSKGMNFTADAGGTWKSTKTTNPTQTVNGVDLIATPSAAVIALAPGLFASETTDWGLHWRAVKLPDIYPTYSGFSGQGGWT